MGDCFVRVLFVCLACLLGVFGLAFGLRWPLGLLFSVYAGLLVGCFVV